MGFKATPTPTPPSTSRQAAPALRAVVFDFDGVVLESAGIKTAAFVELFAHLAPAQVAAVRAHHQANIGISRFKKFEWIYATLLGRPLPDDESRRLGERFSQLALERVLAAPFVPGAKEALDELRHDTLLFVASGTPQEELDRIVDARGLRGHFREVWGSPREKVAIVTDVLARFALAPGNVLFVGDGPSDHRAAVGAGVHFLARSTPEHRAAWEAAGVRRVDDLRGLSELVRSWA